MDEFIPLSAPSRPETEPGDAPASSHSEPTDIGRPWPGGLVNRLLVEPLGQVKSFDTLFVSFAPPWDPFLQSWQDFEADVREVFEADLKLYKHRIETSAAEQGGRHVPKKRGEDHFEWAALYRCGGKTLEEIKSLYQGPNDRTAIFHGIQSIDRLLGLPAYKRPAGRRKK